MFSFLKLASISIPLIFSQGQTQTSTKVEFDVVQLPSFTGSVSLQNNCSYSDLVVPKDQNKIFAVGSQYNDGNVVVIGGLPAITTLSTLSLEQQTQVGFDNISYNTIISSPDGTQVAISYGPTGFITIGPNSGIVSFPSSNPIIGSPTWDTGMISTSSPQIAYSKIDNTLYAFTNKSTGYDPTNDFRPIPVGNASATFYTINSAGSITTQTYDDDLNLNNIFSFDVNQDRFFMLDPSSGTVYIGTLSAPDNLFEYNVDPGAVNIVVSPDGEKLYVTYGSGRFFSSGTISKYSITSSAPFLNLDSSVESPIRGELVLNFDGSEGFYPGVFGKAGGVFALDTAVMEQGGPIRGDFDQPRILATQQNYPYNLYGLSANVLDVFSFVAAPNPLPSFPGQAGGMGNYLNELYSNSQMPADTLAIYTNLASLPYDQQIAALNYLAPQFKIAQFTQEKLDLLIHKEMQGELYSNSKELALFATVGFDHLNQGSSQGYTGYNVTNYYQLLGLSFEACKVKWLTAVGVSESYLKLDPLYSKANYVTTYGAFGLGGNIRKFQLGVDALFGYSFLDTYRKVVNLGNTAKSDHGLWNISVDANFAYKIEKGRSVYTPYDLVGYLYGSENQYTEKGAPGDNFQVKDENISIFRNQLGIKYSRVVDENINAFVDTAWLYQYYTNDNSYKAALVGTDVYQTFNQKIPPRNYGRVHAGFEGLKDRFNWKLAFTGLYGHNFSDSSLSLKLGYKF